MGILSTLFGDVETEYRYELNQRDNVVWSPHKGELHIDCIDCGCELDPVEQEKITSHRIPRGVSFEGVCPECDVVGSYQRYSGFVEVEKMRGCANVVVESHAPK